VKSDAILVEEALEGSEKACSLLVDKYWYLVYNYICRNSFRHELAEEIAQETFTKMFQYLHTYDTSKPMHAWLGTLAKGCMTNCTEKPLGVDIREIVYETPETALEAKQKALQLEEKLNDLPNRQRIYFTMHNLNGISNGDIAAIFRTSTNSVKQQIFRAKKTLRSEYDK